MPPIKSGKNRPPSPRARLIIGGAQWEQHWSVNLQRPTAPGAAAEGRLGVRANRFIYLRQTIGRSAWRPREADNRTLIRRMTSTSPACRPRLRRPRRFSGGENQRDQAIAALADRLLASPRYGERWGRHWLDVEVRRHLREDKDKPGPTPVYRITLFVRSTKQPHARFVQEQIAGDAFRHARRHPWACHKPPARGFHRHVVPETKIDGCVARHIDRDEMYTAQHVHQRHHPSRRCHDHKFDLHTQALLQPATVFVAVDRANRPYNTSSELIKRKPTYRPSQS